MEALVFDEDAKQVAVSVSFLKREQKAYAKWHVVEVFEFGFR